jgi:putative hemolysin
VKGVIAEGAESGAIEASEHELMRRIIRLGDRDVESIMTHRMDVTFIDVNERLEVILEKLHETGHSTVGIDGGPDMVLGIVHVKDLIGLPAGEPATAVREHLKLAPVLAGNVNCLKALELFKSSDAHMAIVIDEYGTTEGIVTAFDLLEAIVGELPSNFEEGEGAQIVKREDGSYLVDGLTPVDEIHLELGLDTFEEDGGYQTIAGFVIDQLGRAPATGDVLEKSGYRFEVIDMDGRRIDKILISRTDPELPFFN